MRLYDLSPAEFKWGIKANADEFHAKVLEQYIRYKPMVEKTNTVLGEIQAKYMPAVEYGTLHR